MPDPLFPDLSAGAQALLRTGYGVLLLATLVQALPEARRFFLSERWGGYARSTRDVDAIQNLIVVPVLLALWLAAAAAIVFGWASPWPALVNVLLCRYFFVHMRWKSVLRGMGAPGFIAYWLGLVVFLLEYTSAYARELRATALLVAQVDLAFIMLSAGIYKATAGYPRNHGMELGLCNPMWGYWWKQYVALPPSHPLIWTMNQLAWGTEVVAAVLMLIPVAREWGGLLLAGSFVFILTQIRLGFLCEMMVLTGVLFLVPGGTPDRWIAGLAPSSTFAAAPADLSLPNALLGAVLWGYLALLPLAHAGLYFNFYARRPLVAPLQRLLERYTNLFGIIIWRVFSVDLVNFFIRIHQEPRAGGERRLAARLGEWPRFNHVGEMICLTSLFTTLKYYPSNAPLFRERLLRYARTVTHPPTTVLVFEYVGVVKEATHFEWVPKAEYRVDVVSGALSEHVLDPTFSPAAAHAASPIHEAGRPGSYAPAPR